MVGMFTVNVKTSLKQERTFSRVELGRPSPDVAQRDLLSREADDLREKATVLTGETVVPSTLKCETKKKTGKQAVKSLTRRI